MNELLEKLDTTINKNLAQIEKDLYEKLVDLDEPFDFGVGDITVFAKGHSYFSVHSIEVIKKDVVVNFAEKNDIPINDVYVINLKNRFSVALKDLDSSSIYCIYEYVILSE